MSLSTFPSLPGLAWPAKRTTKWSSVAQDALSGRRIRVSNFSYPIYQYDLPFNLLRSTAANPEWQTLAAFINRVQGSTGLWLYNDVNDNTATNQQFGAGDGTSFAFQLVRSLGGFNEPVFFPTVSAIAVNGTTLDPSLYSVSSTGIVAFAYTPAQNAILTWSGTFKWGCRFDDDVTEFENFMQNFLRLKSLKFTTEKIVSIVSAVPQPAPPPGLDFSQASNSQYVPLFAGMLGG